MAPQTDTRYQTLPRDSEDSYQESSPHEPLLSPSPIDMGTRTLFHPEFEFEPVYLLRFASGTIALATFVLFVIDGKSEFIGADIFAMLIVLLNALIILSVESTLRQGLKSISPCELKFKDKFKDKLTLKGKARTIFMIFLDVGLSTGLLVCMLLAKNARKRFYWDRQHLKCLKGVYVGGAVFGLQIFLATLRLANKRLFLKVRIASSEPKPNIISNVLYRAPSVESMRKSTGERQSEDQPRRSTNVMV